MNGPQSRDTDISQLSIRSSLAHALPFVQKVETLGKVTRAIRRIDWHRSRLVKMKIAGKEQYAQRVLRAASGIGHGRETCLRSSCSRGAGADGPPQTCAAVRSLHGELRVRATTKTATDRDGVCAAT